MMTELAKLVVTEAATRAVLQAKQDRKAANNNKVTLDHIEAVLPQFVSLTHWNFNENLYFLTVSDDGLTLSYYKVFSILLLII